ncbi:MULTISPECIES: hypothetical protein [unclassified Ralstonia]|uniref:hypothetical protein n=1 Tax=unclassified Ralstonia TaxID=209769 RepID=UPI002CD41460|nr:hypothetical protein [Ralstonia sp.]HWV05013.1 hypothetical protein [Ralstonia sp.]
MNKNTFSKAAALPPALANRRWPHIEATSKRFGISTPAQQAAFIAQIGHESGGFARVTESFNYAVAALPAMFSRFTPALAVTLAALLLGIVCAHYLGNGVIGWSGVPVGLVSDAIKFIAGVFGLTIVGHAYGELPALRRLVHDWLQQAAQRWTGGRKE